MKKHHHLLLRRKNQVDKKIKDKNKDNEMDKKNLKIMKFQKTVVESKDKSPLAQKLPDDDDNIVYLKMHSSLLSRLEIQKLLSESQQNANANEQSGSNASQSTTTTALDSNQPVATVPNIQQPLVPTLPTQHQLPPTMQPPSAVQPVPPVLSPQLCLYNISSQYFLPPAPYVGANEEIVTFSTGTQ